MTHWASMKVALIACVMLAMFATPSFSSGSIDKKEVFCGLGPPPGSSTFVEHQRRQNEQRKALGYLLVCNDALRQYDYASLVRPLDQATKNLAFTPVKLESTPFSRLQLLGAIPDHFGDAGPSALHRTFRSTSGDVIDLFESVTTGEGSVVFHNPANLTKRINGLPAQLVILQAPSGRAVSILSWVEGNRAYELSINTNANLQDSSPSLLVLAQSIPKSASIILRESENELPPAPPFIPPGLR